MIKRTVFFLLIAISLILGLEYLSRCIYVRRYVYRPQNPAGSNILFIGDSQAAIMEPRLQTRLRPYFSVISDCESGTAPDVYLGKMRLLSGLYKPDAVIVSVCATNDVCGLRRLAEPSFIDRIKYYFNLRSFFYHTLRRIWSSVKYRRYLKISSSNLFIRDNRLNFVNPLIAKEAKEDSERLSNNLLLRGSEAEGSWRVFEDVIGSMARLARANESAFVLFIIPDAVQVDRKYRSMYSSYGVQISEEALENDFLQNKIGALAEREGAI